MFVLAVCVASPAWAQTGSLKDLPAYKAPVTYEVRVATVGDALKAISKQAKVSVEPAMSLSDLKVTIYVKAVPAGLLLDKIASVLGCVWRNEDGLEILTLSQDEKDARQRYLDKEDQLQRVDAEKSAHELADAASNASSLTEFAQNYAKDSPPQGFSAPGPMHFRSPLRSPPSASVASPATFALGKLWANWSSSDWNSFWEGSIAYAEMTPPQNDPLRQNGDLQAQRMRMPNEFIFARYDAFGGHTLQFAVPPHGIIPRTVPEDKLGTPTGELASTVFGKEVLAWPDSSAADKDEAFTRQMAGAPKPDQPQALIMADQLASLYNRSGLPIVADCYRNQMPNDRTVTGSNASSWLSSLQSIDHCFVRVEDGVVMVRHPHFWRLRQMEIPETLIQPLAQKQDQIGMMDYAGFLAALTPAQEETLLSLTPPLIDFPTEPIAYSIPGLRFLGSLASVPAMDAPVRLSQLGGNALQLFNDAIYQALFAGGSWSGTGPGPDPGHYIFEMRSKDVMEEGRMMPGVELIFGSSAEDAVTYQVPVGFADRGR